MSPLADAFPGYEGKLAVNQGFDTFICRSVDNPLRQRKQGVLIVFTESGGSDVARWKIFGGHSLILAVCFCNEGAMCKTWSIQCRN